MPRTFSVRSIVSATPRTRIISLDVVGQPFEFQAGQAVMVGLHRSPLRKPYSIASAPVEVARTGTLELLLQLEDSGGPDPHLELASIGTLLDVEGPFGSFGLPGARDEDELLFVGGGTGIAPLRSMLIERLSTGNPSRVSVVYSARSSEELVYSGQLTHLAAAGRIRAYLTVTRDDHATWDGRRGRIDRQLLQEALWSRHSWCLLCGPPALIDEARGWLVELGVKADRILTERF